MCQSILIDGRREVFTFGELKALVGVEKIAVFPPEHEDDGEFPPLDEIEDDNCLCGFDLETTGRNAGFAIDEDHPLSGGMMSCWRSLAPQTAVDVNRSFLEILTHVRNELGQSTP